MRYTTGQPLMVADCPFQGRAQPPRGGPGTARVYPAGSELTPDSVTVTLLPIWAKDNRRWRRTASPIRPTRRG